MDKDSADHTMLHLQNEREGDVRAQPNGTEAASHASRNDLPARGLQQHKSRPGEGVINDFDEEEGEEEEEEDGIDLVKDDDDDDSSEEEDEDDPEEARLIAEGFIVDEEDVEQSDDDAAEKKRKKRRRIRKLRHKKKEKDADEEDLDEDDLDLLAENRGETKSQKRKRFRRGSGSPDAAQTSSRTRDLARIFDDDEDDDDDAGEAAPSRRLAVDDEDDDEEDLPSVSEALRKAAQRKPKERSQVPAPAQAYVEDDMDDFIDDDDDSDEANEIADLDEDEREERRQRKREQKKADKAARRATRGGFAGGMDPNKAGIDADAWEEINDIFGDGSDYQWAYRKGDLSDDGGEGEEYDDAAEMDADGFIIRGAKSKKKVIEFKDIFEPAAIKERMLTDADERVKQIDWPERFQLALPGEDGLKLLETPVESPDLDRATLWMASRISTRCTNDFNTSGGMFHDLRRHWLAAVRLVLEYILIDRLEVPFLYAHRSDQLTHDSPYVDPITGKLRSINYLTRRELHTVTNLAFRWKTLHARKLAIRRTFEQIGISEGGDVGQGVAQTLQFESMLDRVESLEELSDLADWLSMRYGPRMRDAQAIAFADLDLNSNLSTVAPSTFKRPGVVGQYERIKSTAISDLAKRFGISSSELAENLLAGTSARRYFPEDELDAPETLAEQYIHAQSNFRSAEAALEMAKILISHEVGHEPLLRREVRRLFHDHAQITVRPTERGQLKIDEEHPFWNFKYLERKPVKEFVATEAPPRPQPAYGGRQPAQALPSQTQFLLILQAEEESSVTVEVVLPDEAYADFRERLHQGFTSEGVSEVSQKWNLLRKDIIDMAVERSLIPTGRIWVREWLKEECSEWLCKVCEATLDRRVDARPYESRSMAARRRFPSDNDSDGGDDDTYASKSKHTPSVLAVSHGQGDPRRDAIAAVYLDAAGRFRASTTFDHINTPTPEQQEALQATQQAEEARAARRGEAGPDLITPRQKFIKMLTAYRPDVIVVNGFSPRTVQLKQQLESIVAEVRETVISEHRISPEQADKASIDVIHVHDDTARLFQHSQRAADEFPDLKTLHRYCIGLGRYTQSPLLEFASLGDDLLAINFDPYQRLVPQERLRTYLERSIVSSTNEVGVDLNKAVGDAYYRQLLPFICGLGPRKAKALIDAVSRQLEGTVINRRALLEKQIMSWPIFSNASAFLIINFSGRTAPSVRPEAVDPETATDKEKNTPDVLDRTRIHPEDYKFARKMAADALGLDEEDLDDEHSSYPCSMLLDDPDAAKKLRELDIDSYANVLLEKHGDRKKLSLEQCTDELLRPFGELRGPFKLPTQDEMLTILTGETPRTLDRESIVNVTVHNIFPTHITVRLDCGMEGTINEQYLVPLEMDEYASRGEKPPRLRSLVKRDSTLKAQIIDIDKDKLQVELTAKPSHLLAAENMRLQNVSVAVDPRFWNSERAEKDRRQAEFRKQAAKNRSSTSRFVKHPNFRNFKAGQAEEFLANQPRGAVIVRPSSKGSDHLAVTWKVDDGIYQHLDILELEKENEYSLGKILRVMNVTYNDLDELIVNHVNPMAKMVEMLINHEKYKGSETELEQFLTTWCLANPTRSTYAFGIDRNHPGSFKLGFKANREAAIQYWPVKVLPGRFKLHQADHLPDVSSLSNAFKTQYTAMSASARGGATPAAGLGGNHAFTPHGGARTPYSVPLGGGRTPMHGGMTPGRMMAGGATPAGVAYGGMTPAYNGGGGGGGGGSSGMAGPPRPPGPPPGAPPGPPPAFPPPPSSSAAGQYGGYGAPPPPGRPPMAPPGRGW